MNLGWLCYIEDYTTQLYIYNIGIVISHYKDPKVKPVAILGMGDLPPLMGILISWVYKPLRTWVDEFIPYYMEIMGV